MWIIPFNGFSPVQSVTDDTCRALFGSENCCSIYNQHTSECQDVDQTLWDYQDSVILFAQVSVKVLKIG